MSDVQLQVDAWQARTHRMLDRIQTAVLDLVDCGTTDPTPPPARRPSRAEEDATYRPGDDYQPTLKAAGQRSGVSDPTGGQVLAWQAQVRRATTQVAGLVSQVVELDERLALRPLDEHGERLDEPVGLEVVQVEATYTSPARALVDAGPNQCRDYTRRARTWLGASIDRLAERWAAVASQADSQGQLADAGLRDSAQALERSLTVVLRRVEPDEGVSVCSECRRRPLAYRQLGLCRACGLKWKRAIAREQQEGAA